MTKYESAEAKQTAATVMVRVSEHIDELVC